MPKESKTSGKGHRFRTEPLAGGEILCLRGEKMAEKGIDSGRIIRGKKK